jgi:hypothetical protein
MPPNGTEPPRAGNAIQCRNLDGSEPGGIVLALSPRRALIVSCRWTEPSTGIASALGVEVLMSGRRSHVRFAVFHAPDGVLRVMRDVVVQPAGNREVFAISREPAAVGESVVVEFPSGEASACLGARIVESQPVVMDGSVRHRLRLQETSVPSAHRDAEHVLERGAAGR